MMRDPIFIATTLAVLAIVGLAWHADRWALAVYALSFWHYLVYALAFLFRQVPQERFIRDSYILKPLALAALAAVLVATLPNAVSLAAMAAGFGLNIAAAQALGMERTYYGYELAALPPKRITSFPYSVTAHPMLIGNMLAFGGTLLDETFRQAWWPLGLLHVILNLAIILMEAYGGETRRTGSMVAVGSLTLGALLLLAGFWPSWPHALGVAVIVLAFGTVIIRRYA